MEGSRSEESKGQPVVELEDQGPVADFEVVGAVVLGQYNEEVRHGLEAPLETGVDVEVVGLGIVLKESGEEDVLGKGQIEAGTEQGQCCLAVWAGQGNAVVLQGQ